MDIDLYAYTEYVLLKSKNSSAQENKSSKEKKKILQQMFRKLKACSIYMHNSIVEGLVYLKKTFCSQLTEPRTQDINHETNI